MKTTKIVITLLILAAAGSIHSHATACTTSGTIPASMKPLICTVAVDARGGDAPVNGLYIIIKPGLDRVVYSRSFEAKEMLLSLLKAWKAARRVRVARVEVFTVNETHLATVKTTIFSGDEVIWK